MEKILLERIIGRLGAAAVQRSFHDDAIIASHIDEALAAAQALKLELAKTSPLCCRGHSTIRSGCHI